MSSGDTGIAPDGSWENERVTSSVRELIAEGRSCIACRRRCRRSAGVRDGTGRVAGRRRDRRTGAGVVPGDELRRGNSGLERAYAAYRDAARSRTASSASHGPLRTCIWRSLVTGRSGSGWLARAQTLLGEAGESPERGWVALNIGMFEPTGVRKDEHFCEALGVARRARDTDLEFVALSYLGASLVHDDRTEEGMMLLDEALAAVAGSDVEDFCVLEEIFCQLFSACSAGRR